MIIGWWTLCRIMAMTVMTSSRGFDIEFLLFLFMQVRTDINFIISQELACSWGSGRIPRNQCSLLCQCQLAWSFPEDLIPPIPNDSMPLLFSTRPRLSGHFFHRQKGHKFFWSPTLILDLWLWVWGRKWTFQNQSIPHLPLRCHTWFDRED